MKALFLGSLGARLALLWALGFALALPVPAFLVLAGVSFLSGAKNFCSKPPVCQRVHSCCSACSERLEPKWRSGRTLV
eukprot:5844109-Lingulodinium_polyedra.AAC.1